MTFIESFTMYSFEVLICQCCSKQTEIVNKHTKFDKNFDIPHQLEHWICDDPLIKHIKYRNMAVEKSKTSLQVEGIELDTGPHFLCWISGVVPFNTKLISSWEENNCCYKLGN